MQQNTGLCERRYTITWRAVLRDGSQVLRANLFVATPVELGGFVRSAERWALRAEAEQLRSLELVTWCLDTGAIEPEMSFRLLSPPDQRYTIVGPVISFEARWSATWAGQRPVSDTLTLGLDIGQLWHLRDHLDRWVRGFYPDELESFHLTLVDVEAGATYEDYEAGKERIARPEDDVFLALRSRGRLDADFRHYVAFRNMDDAGVFLSGLDEHEDDWIVERVSREGYERGEPEVEAAQSILTTALHGAREDVDGSTSRWPGSSEP